MERAKDRSSYLRLGIFVLTGVTLVIATLYTIGSRKNIFGSTLELRTRFHNVSGLTEGNNVRYGGINIGTVKNVDLENDTTILVTMLIEKKMQKIIRRNALASIGTDGLMGNKIVNISAVGGNAPFVEDENYLPSKAPIETEEMIRTMNTTNRNILAISENIKSMTEKFQNHNTLWKLLADSTLADNFRTTIVNIRKSGDNALVLTGNLKELSMQLKNGKGIGALITDTTIAGKVNQSVVNIQRLSDSAARITGDISRIVKKVDSGKGTMAMLLNDTTFVHKLNESMENIRQGSESLNENLEGLKHSFLLKRYFRKKSQKKVSAPIKTNSYGTHP
jgi:phospholipid/cholesterol/gamma-HCH transport system substrate-binding protein